MTYDMKKFDKYWDMSNKIFAVATFLDPKYKMLAITYFFNLIYGGNGGVHASDILSVIKRLYQEYVLKDQSNRHENASSSHPQEVKRVGDKRKSRFAKFVQTIENEATKTELDIYWKRLFFNGMKQ